MNLSAKSPGKPLPTNDLAEALESAGEPLRDDPRWSLACRIASSPRFSRAAQLRSFLLYTCRRFLAGNVEEISEHEIGVEVFRRGANFDPGQDTIVRVQARQLRKKLDEYFAGEGKDEDLVVSIPKGSYIPEFCPRAKPSPALALAPPAQPALLPPAILGLTALVVLLAIVSALLWKRNVELKGLLSDAREPASRLNPLWARLFALGHKTNVVVGDSNLVLLEDFLGSDITLEQYQGPGYPDNLLASVNSDQVQRMLRIMSEWRNGWYREFGIAKLIFDENRGDARRSQLRFPRGLNVGELKTDNFVMLGSRRSIPWMQLFENRLRFALEYDPQSGSWLRDKSDATHTAYRILRDPHGVHETYARVALVPNLGGTGTVLLLSGLTMEAADSAVRVLTAPDFAARLHRTPGCGTVDIGSGSFEFVLRTRTVVDAPLDSELLSCHPVSASIGPT